MPLLYRWTTVEKAITALKKDAVAVPRWQHFLEHEGRFAKGTSWSLNPIQWQRDNPVCLVMERDALPNKVHAINGGRTFWLTKGMIDKNADPDAYKFESTEPDEEFVEGKIEDFRQHLVAVFMPTPNDELVDLAETFGVIIWNELPGVVVGMTP